MYFNTFSRHPKQPIIVGVVWVVSLIALGLERFQVIELTRMIMFCALMVSLAIPALVISIEISVHLYANRVGHNAYRTMIVTDSGLRYLDRNGNLVGVDDWKKIDHVYLVHGMILIYRDLARMSAIALAELSPIVQQNLINVLRTNLSNRFSSRVRTENELVSNQVTK